MKTHPEPWKTMKTYLEPWKTNLELWKTMKNQPGNMKNQPGTMKNHENRLGTMENRPGTINKQKRYKQTHRSFLLYIDGQKNHEGWMAGVWEGLNLGSIPNFFLCFGMHPKIIDVHPKLIPKGGVVQFCLGSSATTRILNFIPQMVPV